MKVSAKKSLSEKRNADNDTENNTGIHLGIVSNVSAHLEKDVYSYSESYIIVAELGEFLCDVPGMYDTEIMLPDNVREGSELLYLANSNSPSEDDNIAEFYDEAG